MRQLVPPSLSLLAVGVFGLGCTIVRHEAQPPPPPPQPQQQQHGQQVESAPTPATTSTSKPGRVGGLGRGGGAAKRVSSATPFGGPQAAAFRGLAFVVPDGTKTMPDTTQMVPFAQLYTDSFSVASQDFTAGFPGALAGQVENFAIRYEGKFAVPSDGKYDFKLVSDDGAVLYVDGAKVVDNDGLHTSKAATGQASLKAGDHDLKLEYFQAKGQVALQLYLVTAGKEAILTGKR